MFKPISALKNVCLADAIGDPDEVHLYQEGRKCLRCGQSLCMYNPNEHCFICLKIVLCEENEEGHSMHWTKFSKRKNHAR